MQPLPLWEIGLPRPITAAAARTSVPMGMTLMQGNIWSVLRWPEPPIPMLFPSHFSSPQRFLFSLA
jgi:hypothetical protein